MLVDVLFLQTDWAGMLNVIYLFVAGYLRLKRRYRIMCIIRDLKTAKAYIQPSNKVHLQKLESVSISHKHVYTNTLAHLV